ncbi:hypothetical protein EGH24_08315 [Halonotius terrestris]|uniref:Uncharacterized protein n=1 Tax=Halonotius terrestris TaxID=2487750 RepID=A0A8J8TCE8_9EURY|nr:hypothetical protein [Halonotius terrestris]TQQ81128.1 hypothetical protein EGH24_08315 [Halonotius terrestris]
MAQYYDYVLGVIPLVLGGLTGLLSVAGLDLTAALPVGASVSALIIGHALFVNMPTQPTAESTEATHRADAE